MKYSVNVISALDECALHVKSCIVEERDSPVTLMFRAFNMLSRICDELNGIFRGRLVSVICYAWSDTLKSHTYNLKIQHAFVT